MSLNNFLLISIYNFFLHEVVVTEIVKNMLDAIPPSSDMIRLKSNNYELVLKYLKNRS